MTKSWIILTKHITIECLFVSARYLSRIFMQVIASPEVESPDMFSFHIPTLHAKESKWLSNMIILRPLKETIQLSYSIKSSSSNGDLAGTLELTV